MSQPHTYRSIPPIGQNDPFACWAASLAWWLKAVRGGRPSWTQNEIIRRFGAHCAPDGSMPAAKLLSVLPATGELRIAGGQFRAADYRFRPLPIGPTPVLIAFVAPSPIGGTHMNVIFGQGANGGFHNPRWLTAMEPFFPLPGRDGQRSGGFFNRTVDQYIAGTHIQLFWAR